MTIIPGRVHPPTSPSDDSHCLRSLFPVGDLPCVQSSRHSPAQSGHGSSEGAHDEGDESTTAEDFGIAYLAQHLLPCVFQGLGHSSSDVHLWPKFVAQAVSALQPGAQPGAPERECLVMDTDPDDIGDMQLI